MFRRQHLFGRVGVMHSCQLAPLSQTASHVLSLHSQVYVMATCACQLHPLIQPHHHVDCRTTVCHSLTRISVGLARGAIRFKTIWRSRAAPPLELEGEVWWALSEFVLRSSKLGMVGSFAEYSERGEWHRDQGRYWLLLLVAPLLRTLLTLSPE